LAPPLVFIEVPDGGHVVSYREGALAAVSVVEDAEGVRRLRIDNRQQEGDSASLLADGRQAVLPLLLHPAPRRALFLGLGTGVTASSAAEDAAIVVDAVELLPEVVEASAHFTRSFGGGASNPRLHSVVGDARRYVRTNTQRYDIVVADNFHPARSGSGSLYTVEHFLAVKSRLAPGGLFCQWLPLHQMDLQTLRSVVRSFIAVFPGAGAMLATNSLETPVIGLVGRSDDARFDLRLLRDRLAHVALPRGAAEFGFTDDLSLLGSFFAGPAALARIAAGAPLNTDDHPVVAYLAPRITYAPDSRPRDRLLALLHESAVAPADLVDPAADAGWMPRLAAYFAARNRFLEIGRDIQPLPDAQGMLKQVRAPLLGVLRISPDFRPAYDPLLLMADAVSMRDPVAAREVLSDLASIQPARPEAPNALLQLGGSR
jgi:spermidine synthase